MRWDNSQLNKAVGLEARADVDDAILAHAGFDAMNTVSDRLIGELIHAGEEAGLVLDRRDLVAAVSGKKPATFTTRLAVQWHPRDRPCRLIGGPSDGQELSFDVWARWPNVWILTPGLPQAPAFDADVVPERALPVYAYDLDGWDEQSRTWLMRFEGER